MTQLDLKQYITTTRSLRAFKVWDPPNFALAETVIGNMGGAVPVKDVPEDVLDELAARWLASLYEKAGKDNPWRSKRL